MPKPRPQDSKKGGFRLGPKLAKGVYQGHTQKIKATLIHKARVKKAYHKDLAAEGYEGTGANGGELGVRKSGKKAAKPNPGAQRRGPGAEGEEDEDEDGDEGMGMGEDANEDDEDDEDSDDDEDEGRSNKGGRQPKPRPKGKGPEPRSQPPSRFAPSLPTPSATPLPVKRPRLTEDKIEQIKERKAEERKEWGKRGARGQPKLGGRVEMLLARIKKNMA